MSRLWVVVPGVGAEGVVLRPPAPFLLAGRELPPRLLGVAELLAPALLSALVVTQAIAGDRRYVFDARLLGLAAAVVSIRLRAPLLVTIVLAALVAALARAV